jgi:hypothetical protein
VYLPRMSFTRVNHCAASWGICASSHLLVPVSWLSSYTGMSHISDVLSRCIHLTIVTAYFLTLFGTTIVHMHTYPSIWSITVYTVPWFLSPTPNESDSITQSSPHSKRISPPSNQTHDSVIVLHHLRDRFSKFDDVEDIIPEPILFPTKSSGMHPVPRQPSFNRPVWAQNAFPRRGLDIPFVRKEDTTSIESDESTEMKAAPIGLAAPQPRPAQPRRGIDQPFAKKADYPTVPVAAYGESTLQVPHYDLRRLSPLERKHTVSPVFMHKVQDQDSPIPLPKVDEWIQADSGGGPSIPARR